MTVKGLAHVAQNKTMYFIFSYSFVDICQKGLTIQLWMIIILISVLEFALWCFFERALLPQEKSGDSGKNAHPWKYYLNYIQKCINGADSLCWCWCKVKQSNLLNNWVYEHVYIHLKAKLSEIAVKWPKYLPKTWKLGIFTPVYPDWN